MSADAALPRDATRHELSLLRFPDPRTAWVVVLVATAREPVDVTAALGALHEVVPIVGARLDGERWLPGAPPDVVVVDGDPLDDPRLAAPFDLAAAPPMRLLVGEGGRRIGLAVHHAAFDGLAGVAVLDALTGGPMPEPVTSPPAGEAGSLLPLVRRFLQPADRVARSRPRPTADAFAVRRVEISGRETTARLAAACAAACGEHTRRAGKPWRRVGITVALGGPAGVGNVASYRRLDLDAGADVRPAVVEAMQVAAEPAEQVSAPRLLLQLLTPVVERFSDSLLVSNLGRQRAAGLEDLAFFPVARGRSGVVFGAATIDGGASTLAIRAANLESTAAEAILEDAVARFEAGS